MEESSKPSQWQNVKVICSTARAETRETSNEVIRRSLEEWKVCKNPAGYGNILKSFTKTCSTNV